MIFFKKTSLPNKAANAIKKEHALNCRQTSSAFPSVGVVIVVIVISKLLKRYSKAKRTRELIHERCDESKGVSKGGSREAQVRFPEYQEGTE